MERNGVYHKYTIIRNRTGEEVKRPAFVLLPDGDPHARVALRAYAASIRNDNPLLAADIDDWMNSIEPVQSGAASGIDSHPNGVLRCPCGNEAVGEFQALGHQGWMLGTAIHHFRFEGEVINGVCPICIYHCSWRQAEALWRIKPRTNESWMDFLARLQGDGA